MTKSQKVKRQSRTIPLQKPAEPHASDDLLQSPLKNHSLLASLVAHAHVAQGVSLVVALVLGQEPAQGRDPRNSPLQMENAKERIASETSRHT